MGNLPTYIFCFVLGAALGFVFKRRVPRETDVCIRLASEEPFTLWEIRYAYIFYMKRKKEKFGDLSPVSYHDMCVVCALAKSTKVDLEKIITKIV